MFIIIPLFNDFLNHTAKTRKPKNKKDHHFLNRWENTLWRGPTGVMFCLHGSLCRLPGISGQVWLASHTWRTSASMGSYTCVLIV